MKCKLIKFMRVDDPIIISIFQKLVLLLNKDKEIQTE